EQGDDDGSNIFCFPVAVWMLLIRWFVGDFYSEKDDDRSHHVGSGVERVRKQRSASGQNAADCFKNRQEKVNDDPYPCCYNNGTSIFAHVVSSIYLVTSIVTVMSQLSL